MGDLIGIFGGTVDPPHIGHCILAEEACHRLSLAAVFWLPAGEPPHKPDWPISPVEDRQRMVECITEQNPQFEISRIDVDRPGPHYAKDTMALLRESHPGTSFVYLMGADSLRDLNLWSEPELFVQRTDAIGIMPRPHVEYDLTDIQDKITGLSERLQFIPAPLIDISGKIIRERVKAGLPFRYMVTARVYDLIVRRKLYQ